MTPQLVTPSQRPSKSLIGTVTQVLVTTPGYFGPSLDKVADGITIESGGVFFVSGLDDSGDWVRLQIGVASIWVPRTTTNY